MDSTEHQAFVRARGWKRKMELRRGGLLLAILQHRIKENMVFQQQFTVTTNLITLSLPLHTILRMDHPQTISRVLHTVLMEYLTWVERSRLHQMVTSIVNAGTRMSMSMAIINETVWKRMARREDSCCQRM